MNQATLKRIKSILVPFVSALLGATVAVTVLIWSPQLVSKSPNQNVEPRSEREFFDEITKQQESLFKNFDDLFA